MISPFVRRRHSSTCRLFLPLTLAIAPGNSTSVADAIASFDVTFEEGKTYAVTASGVVGGTPAFTLIADDAAQETAPAGQVALNVLHGSPDAPAVDVVVRTGDKIVSNLAYGEFTPYLTVPAGVYYLDIKPAGSADIVATYQADLSGLGGQAIRVLASGYLGSTPGFTLIAVLNDGTVIELPATPVARVQVIHNSPDPTVDVYANSDLLLDNFASVPPRLSFFSRPASTSTWASLPTIRRLPPMPLRILPSTLKTAKPTS